MIEFAEWITTPANLFGLLAFVLVFATVITVSGPALGGNKLDKRIKSVANRREELRRKSREALELEARGGMLRGKDTRSPYRKVVESLNLQTLLEDPNLKNKLIRPACAGRDPSSRSTSRASSRRLHCLACRWPICLP